MTEPIETPLAKTLHDVYRKYAGNMFLGDHLPETWNAVADAARNECGAPELLEACISVRDFLMGLETGLPEDDPLRALRRKVHAPLLDKLLPAIAKACPAD